MNLRLKLRQENIIFNQFIWGKSPDPAGEELHEALVVHVQELVQVDPAEGELAEGPLLPQLGGGGFVTHVYYNLSRKSQIV